MSEGGRERNMRRERPDRVRQAGRGDPPDRSRGMAFLDVLIVALVVVLGLMIVVGVLFLLRGVLL